MSEKKETQIIEDLVLIARRVPPGDRWRLVSEEPDGAIHVTLTDALEAYFQKTGHKCEFRLAPLDSKLYAIHTHEEEIIPEAPKEYSMYGDFKQGV